MCTKRMEPIAETAHFYRKSQDANPTLIVPISNEWANERNEKKTNMNSRSNSNNNKATSTEKYHKIFLLLLVSTAFIRLLHAIYGWALLDGRKWQMKKKKEEKYSPNSNEKSRRKHGMRRARILIWLSVTMLQSHQNDAEWNRWNSLAWIEQRHLIGVFYYICPTIFEQLYLFGALSFTQPYDSPLHFLRVRS